MLGRTHIALGLMTSFLIIPFLGTSLTIEKFNSIAILIAVTGALLPDLDTGTSSLANKFGIIKAKHIKKIWIGLLISMLIITFIFLKDTPIFYGISFIIFLGFIFADKFAKKGYYTIRKFTQSIVGISIIFFAYYYNHYNIAFIGIILILLLFSKHRGLSHSILFLLGCTYAVKKISLTYLDMDYSLIFGISMFSHLLGDMLTKVGIKPFIPFNDKRVKFPYTIKTGGKIEKLIFIGSLFGIFNILKML